MSRCSRAALFLAAVVLVPMLHAKAPLPPTPAPQTADKQSEHDEAERELHQQEQQRILAVVPNFNTVISGQGVRLSPGQKTRLAIRATIDPFNAVSAFLLAGEAEVTEGHRGYGWGTEGYFKRVGANSLDVLDSTMLAGAFYPILLRQDPRFFRQGTGNLRSRMQHAVGGAYVCRGDNGKKQPNFSNVLGNVSGGLLSNLYYPANERGVGLTLENSAIVLVEGSLGNIGLEFSPDVNAWWHRRIHHDEAQQRP
jgi:hypothetical protein